MYNLDGLIPGSCCRVDTTTTRFYNRPVPTYSLERFVADMESLVAAGDLSRIATREPAIEGHVYGNDLKGLERCSFDVSTGKLTRFATKANDNC